MRVVFSFGYFTPAVISALAGGWLVAHASVGGTFLIAGGITLVIAMQAFWRLEAATEFESSVLPYEKGFAAIRRLIRHRPLWPAAERSDA